MPQALPRVLFQVLDDLRYSLRLLQRRHRFAALALFTLALGIGANTAVFSLIRSILLRPLPYPHAEELLWVGGTESRFTSEANGISIPDLMDIRQQARSISGFAVYSFFAERMIVSGRGEPYQTDGYSVSANFFDVLGIPPLIGRTFRTGEDLRGSAPVTVLSHALWTRNYAGDPHVIGRNIILNSVSYTIIGVMPPGFEFPPRTSLWVPIGIGRSVTLMRDGRSFLGVARAAAPAAAAELTAIAEKLEQIYPKTNIGYRFNVQPLARHIVGDVSGTLYMLGGITCFLLLIAIANIANLLLAQAVSRRREIAIRAAVGAGKGRIIQQLLSENLTLAAMGGTLGALLAWWTLRMLRAWNPESLPRAEELSLDGVSLLFALGISILTALLFGLAPALQVLREDQNEALKDSGTRGLGGESGGTRARNLLVMSEIALAIVLLAGAGLFLESLRRLLDVDPGFRPENVLTTELSLPIHKFTTPDAASRFLHSYLERVRLLPGIESAGASLALPMGSVYSYFEFEINGDAPSRFPPVAGNASVSPGYFEAMGIPLKRGRTFGDQDTRDARHVLVISEPLAQQYFAGRDPIGRRIRLFSGDITVFEGEVIGVVGGVRHENLTQEPRVEIYVPFAQLPYPSAAIVVRSRLAPEVLVPAMKQALREVDPELPLFRVRTMGEVVLESAAAHRARGFLTALFAAVALLLASIGIYCVLSYAVSLRTREMGIRIALGATPGAVMRLILWQSSILVALGLAAGLALTLALGRLLSNLLYGVTAFDIRVLTVVSLLLLAVAGLATSLPAWRATRIDAARALRQE